MARHSPLDVAFLGSGNALARSRCWSGFLLNRRYLFDTPPTALLSLNRLEADLAAIDTIFISHFHGDHFFGLPFLFLDYAHRTRRRSDLTLVGPPGLEERVERLMEIGYPRTFSHEAGYRRLYAEVSDGAEGELNGLSFRAVGVEHGEGAMPCLGFGSRWETGGCPTPGTLVGARFAGTGGGRRGSRNRLHLRRGPRPPRPAPEPGRDQRSTDADRPADSPHPDPPRGPITDGGLDRVYVASDLATLSFP